MSSHVVDKLVMELEVELGKYLAQSGTAIKAGKQLEGSFKSAEKSSKSLTTSSQGMAKGMEGLSSSLLTVTRSTAKFFMAITSSTAVERLATHVAKANDQLNFLQQRLGMSAKSIKSMSNAVGALGGDAGAMQSTMKGLNQSIQRLVMMGDASVLPFFNALGVGVVDAQGKARAMDEVMFDMADSLSKLDPQQAYAIASAMGLDDGVANALIQGRDAMSEMLKMQQKMYVSTQEELNASRELRKQQALLGNQWEGLKTMLGNALIPVLTKMVKVASDFTDYLLQNEDTVKNVFEGMAYVIGVVLTAALVKAAVASAALLAPVYLVVGAITALGAGFVLLYDDYKTWANGGESLFDWTLFDKYIINSKVSVDSLKSAFIQLLTGYKSWDEAVAGFSNWARLKGFVSDTGVSVRSLATGFSNLFAEMINSIPLLKQVAEVIGNLMNGNWGAAIDSVKGLYSATVETVKGAGKEIATRMGDAVVTASGVDDDPYASAERKHGLPKGIMSSVVQQETGGNQAYIKDPSKYHYAKNEKGVRKAPNGKTSTAFGPFGILESTAKDPGFGVSPLKSKSLEDQADFMAAYLAARIKEKGSIEGGLGAYGEGEKYANGVMGRMSGADEGRAFSRSAGIAAPNVSNTMKSNEINIQVGGVTVNTSATTLPEATSDGILYGLKNSAGMLDQLAAGL